MIPISILNKLKIIRTCNTLDNCLEFFEKIKENPLLVDDVIEEFKSLSQTIPFYRFFSNYTTGIGETAEEIVAKKFTDIIPKKDKATYRTYNKEFNKKPSNYDLLAEHDKQICIEVKCIRATESKPKSTDKLTEIPSLLEERALSYSEAHKISNPSFQQTKAAYFDYLVGVVIYSDVVDFYLVPSADIKSGKLEIKKQHAGAIFEGTTNEGHLIITELSEYKFLSVYSEDELLAADTLGKYIK
jgi:hypothetical protein